MHSEKLKQTHDSIEIKACDKENTRIADEIVEATTD